MPQNLRAGANQAVILGRCGSLFGVQELIQIFENRSRRFSTPQQHHHTSASTRNVAHGSAIRPSRRARGVELGAEQVTQGVHRLHSHRHRTGLTEITEAERKVQHVVDQISKGVQRKRPPLGVDRLGAVKLNRLLMQ